MHFAREDRRRYQGFCRRAPTRSRSPPTPRSCPSATPTTPSALAEQEDLQSKYTGGTVLHLYMGEALYSGEASATLVRRSTENFHLPCT